MAGMKFISVIFLFVFAQELLFSAYGAKEDRWCNGSLIPRADPHHLETLAADGDKFCIVRHANYSEEIFQLWAGYYCCFYMNEILFNPNTPLCIDLCTIANKGTYPCFWESEDYNCRYPADSNTETFFFDYTNEKAVSILREKGFKKGARGFDNWIQCSKAAETCCDNMREEDIQIDDGHCTANWDGWTCLDRSRNATTQHKPCPDYIYSAEPPTCQRYSNKMCTEEGIWATTSFDYITCSPTTMLRDRILYHVSLLSVSIAVALPALIIFFSYTKLQVTRVILHRNLVMAIIIRNTFTIVVKTVITLEELTASDDMITVMDENSAWCRMISFMDKLSNSAVYSCFLLEGIYLHRLIAAAFKGDPKMLYYYLGATGFAVLPVVAWTVVTAINNDVYCWTIDRTSYLYYILDVPRIFILVVNAILMLDIVRVLFTKLRNVNTVKSNQIRRMTRATILLTPLFGVQFLVVLVRPNTDNCDLEQVYYYVFYTMDGLQGSLVVLLFCYLNKEVQVQLQRTYTRLQIRFHELIGKEYKPKHHPTWVYSEHPRTTVSVVAADEAQKTDASLLAENPAAKSN